MAAILEDTNIAEEQLQLLSQNLTVLTEERDYLRATLNVIEEDIKKQSLLLSRNDGPRESSLQEDLKEMELRLRRANMSAGEERRLVGQIEKLKSSLKAAQEADSARTMLSQMRDYRTNTLKELRAKEAALTEVNTGVRRLRLSQRVNVPVTDIIERSVQVPRDNVPMVIGKAGQNLRNMEEAYGVSIDVSRAKPAAPAIVAAAAAQGKKVEEGPSTAMIMGTQDAVENVVDRIAAIIDTRTESFKIADEKAVLLLQNRAARVQELQTTYQVRIDLSRAEQKMTVTGTSGAVTAVRAAVAQMSASADTIYIHPSAMGAVVGKGGENLQRLQTEHGVTIDMDKEKGIITVKGAPPGVVASAAFLRSINESAKEVDDEVVVDRALISVSLLQVPGASAGGATDSPIKALCKEHGVSIVMSKRGDNTTTSDDIAKLILKGPSSRVAAARARLDEMIQDAARRVVTVPIPEQALAAVIGKKGSRLISLRESHPLVAIDLAAPPVSSSSSSSSSASAASVGRVYLFANDNDALHAAREEVNSILMQNDVHEFAVDRDLCILLKSGKASILRDAINKGFSVSTTDSSSSSSSSSAPVINMDINVDHEVVRLRGPSHLLPIAEQEIRVFQQQYLSDEVSLTPEDEMVLLTGGGPNKDAAAAVKEGDESAAAASAPAAAGENVISRIQRLFGVECRLLRAEHVIKFRGTTEAISHAKSSLSTFLDGNGASPLGYSLLVDIDPLAMGAVIGKGGSNIKALEERYAVDIDVVKSKSALRIRGGGNRVKITRPIRASTASSSTSTEEDGEVAAQEEQEEEGEEEVEGGDENGGEGNVKAARATLLESLATIRVTQNVVVEDVKALKEGGGALVQKVQDAIRRSGLGAVSVELGATSVILRGLLHDVSEAELRVREVVSGITFDSFYVGKTRASILLQKSPSSGETLISDLLRTFSSSSSSSTQIDVSIPTGKINLRGAQDACLQAKLAAFRLLDRVFPGEFGQVVLPPITLNTLLMAGGGGAGGERGVLAEIESATGVEKAYVDRSCSCVRLVGQDVSTVNAACVEVRDRAATAQQLVAILTIENELAPLIIGKSGAGIKALEKTVEDGGIRIKLSGAAGDAASASAASSVMTATITADTPEALEAAKEAFENRVNALREGMISIPASTLGRVIGKGGVSVQKIQEDHSVTIDVKETNEQGQGGHGGARAGGRQSSSMSTGDVRLFIQGDDIDNIRAAVAAIRLIVAEVEATSYVGEITIDANMAGRVIGPKGATIKELQGETSARIDINNNNKGDVAVVRVKGAPSDVNMIIEGIKSLLGEELVQWEINRVEQKRLDEIRAKQQAAQRQTMPALPTGPSSSSSSGAGAAYNKHAYVGSIPVGASSAMIAQLTGQNKKRRRRNKTASSSSAPGAGGDDNEEGDEEGVASAPAAAAPVVAPMQPKATPAPVVSKPTPTAAASAAPVVAAKPVVVEDASTGAAYFKSKSGLSIRL